MRLFLIPSALFLLACTGLFQPKDEDDDTTTSSSSSSSSSTSDTNTADTTTETTDTTDTTDTTTTTTDTTTTTSFSPCADYSAFDKGTTWTYSFADSSGNTGTTVTKVTQRNVGAGTLTMVTDGDFQVEGTDSYTQTVTENYHCDTDGFFLDHVETAYEYVVSGKTYSGTTSTDYTDPALLEPPFPQKGDTWTASGSAISTDQDGVETPFDYSVDCEITKSESVTVEAGKYTALKQVCGNPASTIWLAKGVGTIKSDSTELIEFTP